MTFWDFCDKHITGFTVFVLVALGLGFVLLYDLGTLWYNAHRSGVIAKLSGKDGG